MTILDEFSAPAVAADVATPANGQVIAVYSAKGGCGKSLVAVNLAVTIADSGARVCLIDLDLAFGDTALLLELTPEHTLADAVDLADRIDESALPGLVTPYRPGLDVLLGPVSPTEAEQVSRELVERVIRLARAAYDVVVLDCPTQLSEPTLAGLDAAHRYVLVSTPELPALKSLRVTMDTFDLLDYRRQDRIVVLNQADAKSGLSVVEVERIARVSMAVQIPASRDVRLTVNHGVPITVAKPSHPVAEAIRSLADRHLGYAPASRPAQGVRRLLKRR